MADAEGSKPSSEIILKKMVMQRGHFKATITRVLNSLMEENPDDDTELAKDLLLAKKERIAKAMDSIESLTCELGDDMDIAETEGKFLKASAIINNKLSKFSRTTVEPSKIISKIKLPNILVPEFDGKSYVNFSPFIKLFEALIHNDKSLADIQKLYYLRTFLKGEAYDLIKNLPMADESYIEAMQIIKDRYENKNKVINDHICILLDIPVVKHQNVSSLRTFISVAKQQITALKNMDQPIEAWDSILVCILSRKLDTQTNKAFHLDRDSKKLTSVIEFFSFLEKRALALENSSELTTKQVSVSNIAIDMPKCSYCKLNHKLYICNKFKLAPIGERIKFIHKHDLCKICLNKHHSKCRYNFKCTICKKQHNTLLHEDVTEEVPLTGPVTLFTNAPNLQVLLPTAKVRLVTRDGKNIYIKALLDSGSQVSFITSEALQVLGYIPTCSITDVVGIGNTQKTINSSVQVDIFSCVYNYKFRVNCHVVDNITTKLPQTKININNVYLPNNIKLADDTYNIPSNIHILLGADIFFQSMLSQPRQIVGDARIIDTKFGHIIAGILPGDNYQMCRKVNSLICIQCNDDISDLMQKFWQSESIPEAYHETETEKIFKNSVSLRNNKFEVALPLKLELSNINKSLGNSFNLALSRFINLEKRFQKNHNLLQEYKAFINEYVELKHASYIDINNYDLLKDPVYFLSHHPVIKEESKTTRLRVVFDGSMRTNTKISLNDLLLNGPVVQNDLFQILLLFRLNEYIFITDIRRMFRNILVKPEHRSLLNILWRESPQEHIKCLQLNTVTYGLKSSSYLATRCLKELALLHKGEYPLASEILINNTYVDDILVSSQSIQELKKMQEQLIKLLKLGDFSLHKWASNVTEIYNNIPKINQQFNSVDLEFKDLSMKTLGIKFNFNSDSFQFSYPNKYHSTTDSKREILSFISRFYDPLGLLGPIIVLAKLFMQKLWISEVDWDTPPSIELRNEWHSFADSLSNMKIIQIKRKINIINPTVTQIIGYADASSKKAYGCCIYLRQIDTDGNVYISLLCSKSRVNPIKNKLTIPKLELNAALVLANLTEKVYNTLKLKLNISNIYLYSDSQIVLCWIKKDPNKLQAYVANRVKLINQINYNITWLYAKTNENPADLISRGVLPHELNECKMWWHGPQYLSNLDYNFISLYEVPLIIPEISNETVTCNIVCDQSNIFESLKKFSNISKMQRVLAYVLKFCNNVKPTAIKITSVYLSTEELNKALNLIIRYDQSIHFHEEINSVKTNNKLKGHLQGLHPFLDNNGLLRVGGRLHNANIAYEQRHPIILPKNSNITNLIIHKTHLKLLHAGQKLILSNLSQYYYLINAVREIKKVIYKCIICFKLKAIASKQLMGSLPADRVNVARPFQKVGIDFAGPIQVKQSKIRSSIISKGYIAVYVCFVTKAIHLEVVSDLTTNCFLASFKRFISRRNMPTDVYSDNAKTFKGADNKLQELYQLFNSQKHQHTVHSQLADLGIKFHFIPSYSPVFGGLWEAGVKSTKYHLKRVIGETILTYEELNTVITCIEAILNSRPITPMSTDINDFSYLTPGHFLTGAPLMSYPERNVSNVNIGRLKLWNICTHMQQSFWKVWHKNYLNILQNRPKWKDVQPNLLIGSLVILKQDNLPPLQWPMARIVKVIPGKDGQIRVAEVKTCNGTFLRSVTKICVLPIEI